MTPRVLESETIERWSTGTVPVLLSSTRQPQPNQNQIAIARATLCDNRGKAKRNRNRTLRGVELIFVKRQPQPGKGQTETQPQPSSTRQPQPQPQPGIVRSDALATVGGYRLLQERVPTSRRACGSHPVTPTRRALAPTSIRACAYSSGARESQRRDGLAHEPPQTKTEIQTDDGRRTEVRRNKRRRRPFRSVRAYEGLLVPAGKRRTRTRDVPGSTRVKAGTQEASQNWADPLTDTRLLESRGLSVL